jgi:hypothetical protein
MNVRPGVPWINSPQPYFTSHGYSELLAYGLPYTIEGKTVKVIISKSLPEEKREEIILHLKTIAFDGLNSTTTVYIPETDSIEVSFNVE